MSIETPSINDMQVAALWLEANEGDDEERGACKRVAAWLEKQIENKELRSLARETGVSVANVRKAILKANQ